MLIKNNKKVLIIYIYSVFCSKGMYMVLFYKRKFHIISPYVLPLPKIF